MPLKSLVIQNKPNRIFIVEEIVRIAHAEAHKILKSEKVRIDIRDVILRPYGWVVVFSFGCSEVQGGIGQNMTKT